VSKDRHHELCAAMAKALLPLANVARAIDEGPSCAEHKRPDGFSVWEATRHMTHITLTMGDARAARRASLAWLAHEIAANTPKIDADGLPTGRVDRIAFAMGMDPGALRPLLVRLHAAGLDVVKRQS
jgi:hypothetical protein